MPQLLGAKGLLHQHHVALCDRFVRGELLHSWGAPVAAWELVQRLLDDLTAQHERAEELLIRWVRGTDAWVPAALGRWGAAPPPQAHQPPACLPRSLRCERLPPMLDHYVCKTYVEIGPKVARDPSVERGYSLFARRPASLEEAVEAVRKEAHARAGRAASRGSTW